MDTTHIASDEQRGIGSAEPEPQPTFISMGGSLSDPTRALKNFVMQWLL
jgi:hypothetical protein